MELNPILVENWRGNVLESFHRGSVCIVNEKGDVIYQVGNIHQVSFPRSALKLIQVIPLLLSGAFEKYGFGLKELAIMCGSHNGEPMHTDLVQSIFKTIGLEPSCLQCGAQSPTHKKDWLQLINDGIEPEAIHNNCSGKHAGFLAWCMYYAENTNTYLNANHPLHIAIKKITAQFYEIEENQLQMGIDGCSAPIFAMPLINQALAYKNLLCTQQFNDDKLTAACDKILQAIAQYPQMLAGTRRYCTDLIANTKGKIIGKTGADGVYCIAVPAKKWGIAIKVDDGKMGPQYHVAQAVLEHFNLINEDESASLRDYLISKNKNFAGNIVGETRVSEILVQKMRENN